MDPVCLLSGGKIIEGRCVTILYSWFILTRLQSRTRRIASGLVNTRSQSRSSIYMGIELRWSWSRRRCHLTEPAWTILPSHLPGKEGTWQGGVPVTNDVRLLFVRKPTYLVSNLGIQDSHQRQFTDVTKSVSGPRILPGEILAQSRPDSHGLPYSSTLIYCTQLGFTPTKTTKAPMHGHE